MKILLIGASGYVGSSLMHYLKSRSDVIGLSRTAYDGLMTVDYYQEEQLVKWIKLLKPDAVINAAGYKDVPGCEKDPAAAFAANAHLPHTIARSLSPDIKLIHISTDYVYTSKNELLTERSDTDPDNVYGRSKLAGEILIRDVHHNHLIIRTGGLYCTRHRLFKSLRDAILNDRDFPAFNDIFNTPTFIKHLAYFIYRKLVEDDRGIRNFSDRTTASRYDLVREYSICHGLDYSKVSSASTPHSYNIPPFLALGTIYDNHESTSLYHAMRELKSEDSNRII